MAEQVDAQPGKQMIWVWNENEEWELSEVERSICVVLCALINGGNKQ